VARTNAWLHFFPARRRALVCGAVTVHSAAISAIQTGGPGTMSIRLVKAGEMNMDQEVCASEIPFTDSYFRLKLPSWELSSSRSEIYCERSEVIIGLRVKGPDKQVQNDGAKIVDFLL